MGCCHRAPGTCTSSPCRYGSRHPRAWRCARYRPRCRRSSPPLRLRASPLAALRRLTEHQPVRGLVLALAVAVLEDEHLEPAEAAGEAGTALRRHALPQAASFDGV